MARETSGRTVLITGASSGIGAALAREVAARGATVGLVARREDRLAEVAGACGPGAHYWVADLEDPDAAGRVAAAALDGLGHVDVLVNNAATPGVRAAQALSPGEVERVMQVNFHAPVRLTLALLPHMLERGAGTIVNVSSLGGRLGIRHEGAYCASKFALSGWSESLALDLWETPLQVKLIVPGAVDTEIWDHPDTESDRYEVDKVPATEVAAGIADAIDSDRFEHYLPDMQPIAVYKAKHIDEFMAGCIAALPPGAPQG